MLGISIYVLPIYAVLILGLIGLRSSFWRLHAVMAVMSILTLYVVSQFFIDPYVLQEDTKLATGFFDALFGAIVTFTMIKFEPQKIEKKHSRLYLYYAIILSVFFATSLLNVVAWGLDQSGLYEGSFLEGVYNKTILTANIIQLLCMIEGGLYGFRNIYNDIVNRGMSALHSVVRHKESHPKLHKKE